MAKFMNFRNGVSLCSIIAGLLATPAVAQTTTAPTSDSAKDLSEDFRDWNEIVVTGSIRPDATALNSSVAISTITSEELSRQAPFGYADALKAIPGFFVQESGGQTSNNVGIRGLPAQNQFEFIGVQEDGLLVNYDRYTTDAVQRYDIGIQRIEATRGGNSGIFAPNAAGALINNITRIAGNRPEGDFRLSVADYGYLRGDFFFGAPVTDSLGVTVSGYWQYGDTPRNTGFNGERGGQVRIALRQEIEGGWISLSYKRIDEQNQFILPLPVVRNPATGNLSELPGFDLNRGNVVSRFNTRIPMLFADGSRVVQNVRDGADTKADIFALQLKKDLGDGITLRHGTRYTNLNRVFNAHFTGSAGGNSLRPASQFLTDNSINFGAGYGTVGAFFAANPGTDRCLRTVQSGQLACVGSPALANLGGNGFAQVLNSLYEPIQRQQVISDTKLEWITERNSLVAGFLFAGIDHKRRLQSSLFLSEANSNNPRMLDIVAANPAGGVVASLSDAGVVRHGQFVGDDAVDTQSYSFYANDELQVTDNLRVDFGARYETATYNVESLLGLADRVRVAGSLTPGGLDTDNVLANNFARREFGNGTSDIFQARYNNFSYSLGFNYTFNNKLAAYGRFASGNQLPRVDRLADLRINGIQAPASELKFGELGMRYQNKLISASVTGFYTRFDNLLTGGVGLDPLGNQILFAVGLDVFGAEFEASVNPTDWLQFDLSGVLQRSRVGATNTPGGPNFQGNRPARTPDAMLRGTVTVSPTDFLDIFATYDWQGARFGANDNIVRFASAGQLDLGAVARFKNGLSLRLVAQNLTNAIIFNEGNPRNNVAENLNEFGFARPVVGRTIMGTLGYRF